MSRWWVGVGAALCVAFGGVACGGGVGVEPNLGAPLASEVAAGDAHSLWLRDGVLRAFGAGDEGQLGLGDREGREAPARVEGLPPLRAIAASGASSVVVDRDGQIWGWGAWFASAVPVAVDRGPFVGVAMGQSRGVLLGADGRVWTVGPAGVAPVAGLEGITRIAAGGEVLAAVRRDGALFTWGSNRDGALGNGQLDDLPHPAPVRVAILGEVVDVACGARHVLALEADGQVWSWGWAAAGQLGLGAESQLAERPQAQRVTALEGVSGIGAGNHVSFAVRPDGALWAWGQNPSGQLGLGAAGKRSRPEAVVAMPSVRAIAAGQQHTLAVTREGALWAWGFGGSGQLGVPLPVDANGFSYPVRVSGP